MSFSLNGKTCLVTGAGRGIGKAIALAMAKSGADVAITDIQTDAAMTVKEEIEGLGRKSMVIQANAVDFNRAEEVIDTIVEEWGKLDVLVNNAGITRDSLIMRMNEDQWDSVISVNLKSVFNYSKAAIKPMMRQRNGAIISISSVVGIMGNAGQTNYSASKAGIIGFSKSLAKEVGSRNIRVNAVAPGYIKTEMTEKLSEKVTEAMKAVTPLKRQGTVDEVANAVIFLASDASSYITGSVLKVDGGMAM